MLLNRVDATLKSPPQVTEWFQFRCWEKEPPQLVPHFVSRKCPEPSVSPHDHARYDTDIGGRVELGDSVLINPSPLSKVWHDSIPAESSCVSEDSTCARLESLE
jgi:hypothetical protein